MNEEVQGGREGTTGTSYQCVEDMYVDWGSEDQ